MKKLCVYYTRSGISKEIAEKISKETESELLFVTDGHQRKGVIGYILAAIDGLKKKLPVLQMYETETSLEEYDVIYAVAPVWCETICPVMRAFFTQNKDKIKGDIYFVLTHMSDISYENKVNVFFENLFGKKVELLSLQTSKCEYMDKVSDFIQKTNK